MKVVAPGLYRGPRPTCRELADREIASVLNLESWLYEWVHGTVYAPIREFRVPMGGIFPPTRGKLAAAVALMKDVRLRPFLVHCREGVDRTGLVVAAYRTWVQGWSVEAAYREMLDEGFHRGRYFYWPVRRLLS